MATAAASRSIWTPRSTTPNPDAVLDALLDPADVGPLLVHLLLKTGRVSVHAYFGAQIGGQMTVEAVRFSGSSN